MAPTTPFILKPGRLRAADLAGLGADGRKVALDPAAWSKVEAARRTVEAVIEKGGAVYGVNTGFGALAKTRIPADQVNELQRRLVLSHMAGVGKLLPDRVVRLVMIAKANTLARGHSGVRRIVIETLLALVNAGIIPCIPAKGSVGASGDLAPLAHLTGALIGEGDVRVAGLVMPAAAALRQADIPPVTLGAKEGLSMLNGTQVSAALALDGLAAIDRVFRAALVAGALSLDAAAGSDMPFDPRIQAVRGQPGQEAVAEALRALTADSPIRASHVDCDRVQDPYSLRCMPQVMGAVLDTLRFAAGIVERELNAVSDNPLVFADTGEILSGGNFHAEPVAFAADAAAIALCEIGNMSERRIALLVDAHMSGLPAFLVPEPGLNSGFMIAQITAAALASENKALAHPASVDTIPTTANQEDHVSMATHAARRLSDMAENAAAIVAIELLAAAQGVELRRPLKTSPALQRAMDLIRARVPFWQDDRQMAPDIAAGQDLVTSGEVAALTPLSLFA